MAHNPGRLEEELRQSEERFKLLVESVQDYAIFMLDPTGHIMSWNRGAERIKGYSEEEVLGKHFSIFYTDPDRESHFPDHELTVAARVGRFEDEGWRVKKDGTLMWANVVITALRDEDGRLVGFGKVTRDLTERVQAEAERQALQREREARRAAEELAEEVQTQARHLEEQSVELETLNERLVARTEEAERARAAAEAANRAKSDFLASMSHELRTPINAIIGYTDLLELGIAGPVNESQRAHLERVRVSSRHLLVLVEDILDLSKIEAGRVEIARDRGRIADSVQDALTLLEPRAVERGIEVVDRCRRDGGPVYTGDEDRVRQILANLLSNAVKFTEPGGRITIGCELASAPRAGARLEGPGPWACVSVADTGIGIAPEHHESIFDPFVQVDSGWTRTRGGTGLGLAISRQLARLMDGDLTLESTLGEGSRFTLWLPVHPRAGGA